MTRTQQWISKVVIGLNMCPFAEKSSSQEKIFYTVIRGDDREDILSSILKESILREDNAGTTVIICPELSPRDFRQYLDTVSAANDLLEDYELDGIVQVSLSCLFHLLRSGYE